MPTKKKHDANSIEFRIANFTVSIPATNALASEEEFWSFAVAQRDWWARAEKRSEHIADLARESLEEVLGINRSSITYIGEILPSEILLEIHIPEENVEAIHLPWEYIVTAASQPGESPLPPTIVRCIKPNTFPQTPPPRSKRKALYIEALPGDKLKGSYEFDTERELLKHLESEAQENLINPSLKEVQDKIKKFQPDVIHIAGVDTHHAYHLLKQSPTKVFDGVMLADRPHGRNHKEVSAEELASALCSGSKKPELVIFNLYNSSSELGAMAVKYGAEATIGFQHDVDDSVAELFIAELYRMLGPRKLPTASAFVAARERMRDYSQRFRGSGIVMWSCGSRLDEWKRARNSLDDALRDLDEKPLVLKPDREWMKDIIIDVVPHNRVNYSLLHNQHPLFRQFDIRKLPDGVLSDLTVKTVLQVGSDIYQSEILTNLSSRLNDLRSRIRIPLTWNLNDFPTETVQTTLSVDIRCNKRDLWFKSFPVHLQTPDVWVDDDVNRQWLPSFVLPRDTAVRKILASAQRYLVALADDITAGFDGYQSVDLNREDPFALVDTQVQAIWTALVQDFSIHYVNPPPTFALMSQRLRSPTAVMEAGRGTCIDLALILAACLEYVEIYPAIFLLDGHAFVGYWRSEEGYNDFLDQVFLSPWPSKDLDPDQTLPDYQKRTKYGTGNASITYPWVYTKYYYRSIFNAVQRRQQLVPLEATGIPLKQGFWQAIDQGIENLRSIHDFHTLVDIVAARDNGVTPLPFRERTT